jgi:hypothetical protein
MAPTWTKNIGPTAMSEAITAPAQARLKAWKSGCSYVPESVEEDQWSVEKKGGST